MHSSVDRAASTRAAFPHSEILGSRLVCSSPRLIAADHVLRRLSAPRHPSRTLRSLTTENLCRNPDASRRRSPRRIGPNLEQRYVSRGSCRHRQSSHDRRYLSVSDSVSNRSEASPPSTRCNLPSETPAPMSKILAPGACPGMRRRAGGTPRAGRRRVLTDSTVRPLASRRARRVAGRGRRETVPVAGGVTVRRLPVPRRSKTTLSVERR